MLKRFLALLLFVFTLTSWIYSQSIDSLWVRVLRGSTVSIGFIDSSNNSKPHYVIKGTGSIFYINYNLPDITLVLVTAKHVFCNPREKWFPPEVQLRLSSEENKSFYDDLGFKLDLNDGISNLWYPHPDSNVDLAAILLPQALQKLNYIVGYKYFPSETDVYEGADVLVLGYPGWVGENFLTRSILRKGIISWVSPTHPDSNLILIDCNIFPGNSGGPVFKLPSGVDQYGRAIGKGSIKFLGIVSQLRRDLFQPPFTTIDTLLLPPSNQLILKRESPLSLNYMGIGVIEPASRVRQLLDFINNVYLSKKKSK